MENDSENASTEKTESGWFQSSRKPRLWSPPGDIRRSGAGIVARPVGANALHLPVPSDGTNFALIFSFLVLMCVCFFGLNLVKWSSIFVLDYECWSFLMFSSFNLFWIIWFKDFDWKKLSMKRKTLLFGSEFLLCNLCEDGTKTFIWTRLLL